MEPDKRREIVENFGIVAGCLNTPHLPGKQQNRSIEIDDQRCCDCDFLRSRLVVEVSISKQATQMRIYVLLEIPDQFKQPQHDIGEVEIQLVNSVNLAAGVRRMAVMMRVDQALHLASALNK